MARPKADPNAEHTRDRVLLAAAEVFARRGAAAATLAEIALAAGIRRPSLLYHFPTKDALYEAVVRQVFAHLASGLGRSMSREASFPQRLEHLARWFAEFLAAHPHHARIILREMVEERGPGVSIIREQVAPLLETVVAFVERAGRGHLRSGLPIRAAVLQVVADVLLQNAAAGVQDVMWGGPDPDRTWALVQTLFLEGR
jgi:AcrR family transcriptional regulator